MQLSDILEDTDAIDEAVKEIRFQAHLKRLNRLPTWKKKELELQFKKKEFGFADLIRIFDCNDKI